MSGTVVYLRLTYSMTTMILKFGMNMIYVTIAMMMAEQTVTVMMAAGLIEQDHLPANLRAMMLNLEFAMVVTAMATVG